MQRLAAVFGVALALIAARAAVKPSPPTDGAIPALAASLSERIAARELPAPDGGRVALSTLLDAGRLETCLRTIGKGGGWPASWLIVVDSTRPYDLVLRIAQAPDGTIADPETAFLATRRPWDDDAFEAAFRAAVGSKPPHERQRNVVVQSFTKRIVTDYVYDLPATGRGAKGLLAFLPEGSLLREATTIDLGDGLRHTFAIVLIRPRFLPADCATPEGRRTGHRDAGGVLLALAGETALEDQLDITELVRGDAPTAILPRFPCAPGDTEPGAIDALVDRKFEGREPVRLLDFPPGSAAGKIRGTALTVGADRRSGTPKIFAAP